MGQSGSHGRELDSALSQFDPADIERLKKLHLDLKQMQISVQLWPWLDDSWRNALKTHFGSVHSFNDWISSRVQPILKGSANDRLSVLWDMSGGGRFDMLKAVVVSEIGRYATSSKAKKLREFWIESGINTSTLLPYITSDQMYSKDAFLADMKNRPEMDALLLNWFTRILLFNCENGVTAEDHGIQKLLRPPKLQDYSMIHVPLLLQHTDVLWFVQNHVPVQLRGQKEPWTLLFSTRLHGVSFIEMIRRIQNQPHTLVIVKEKSHGRVFGAYSEAEWRNAPSFYGSSTNALFSLSHPMGWWSAMKGYNDHFQFFQQGAQTITNGIGWGGQLDYFGLFIDPDFRGHSRAKPMNTTYQSPQLSSNEEFLVDDMEVWTLQLPKQDENDVPEEDLKYGVGKAARRKEAMEFLDMAGMAVLRKKYGLEPADDEDEVRAVAET